MKTEMTQKLKQQLILAMRINKQTEAGLSLRAGDRGFSPATFIGKQKKNTTKRNP